MDNITISKVKFFPENQGKYAAKKHPRIHFFVDGENMLDNLRDRFDRPAKLYRTFFPEVFKMLKIEQPKHISWSRYAGCACGCNPGFIVMDPEMNGVNDISVHIKVGVKKRTVRKKIKNKSKTNFC